MPQWVRQHGFEAYGFNGWKLSLPDFFRNNEGFPYKVFRYWDKKISTEKSDTHSTPLSLPLSSVNFIDTRNFLKHRRVRLRILWYCETKLFRRKVAILPHPPPPLLLIFNSFRYQKFSETQKGSTANFFGTLRQKTLQKIAVRPLLHKV